MGEHPPSVMLGVFPGGTWCNMDLFPQALHTLTKVFLTSTALQNALITLIQPLGPSPT